MVLTKAQKQCRLDIASFTLKGYAAMIERSEASRSRIVIHLACEPMLCSGQLASGQPVQVGLLFLMLEARLEILANPSRR